MLKPCRSVCGLGRDSRRLPTVWPARTKRRCSANSVKLHCASASTSSTLRPAAAKPLASVNDCVVLPTPPLKLYIVRKATFDLYAV